MDYLQKLGMLALASRLRRLTDRLYHSGERLYEMAGLDFHPRWFMIVSRLNDADGEALPITTIADDLGVTHPGIINLVRDMESKGIVTSVKDKNDARKRGIRLTSKGKKLVSELDPVWSAFTAATQELFEELDCDLITVINRMETLLNKEDFSRRVMRLLENAETAEIITYEPELAKHFRTLNEEWLTEYFSIEEYDRKQLENPGSQIIDPGGQIFFARVGDCIVGTVALIQIPGQRFELAKMAVTKEFRGRGIGDSLIGATIEYARNHHMKQVVLHTHPIHREAIHLYRKHGFEVKHADIPSTNTVERSKDGFSMVLNVT